MTKIMKKLTWPSELVDLSDKIWEIIDCPCCHGDGWVYSFESGRPEIVECIECEGSGSVGLTRYMVEFPVAS